MTLAGFVLSTYFHNRWRGFVKDSVEKFQRRRKEVWKWNFNIENCLKLWENTFPIEEVNSKGSSLLHHVTVYRCPMNFMQEKWHQNPYLSSSLLDFSPFNVKMKWLKWIVFLCFRIHEGVWEVMEKGFIFFVFNAKVASKEQTDAGASPTSSERGTTPTHFGTWWIVWNVLKFDTPNINEIVKKGRTSIL